MRDNWFRYLEIFGEVVLEICVFQMVNRSLLDGGPDRPVCVAWSDWPAVFRVASLDIRVKSCLCLIDG